LVPFNCPSWTTAFGARPPSRMLQQASGKRSETGRSGLSQGLLLVPPKPPFAGGGIEFSKAGAAEASAGVVAAAEAAGRAEHSRRPDARDEAAALSCAGCNMAYRGAGTSGNMGRMYRSKGEHQAQPRQPSDGRTACGPLHNVRSPARCI